MVKNLGAARVFRVRDKDLLQSIEDDGVLEAGKPVGCATKQLQDARQIRVGDLPTPQLHLHLESGQLDRGFVVDPEGREAGHSY